jgi:hypothetical protein
MSWNSRSKLNFSQCFKQIHTHTHKIRVHFQKKPNIFKPYPEGCLVEWWMIHLFSCESPSLKLNFCYLSFNLSYSYFPGKAQHPPRLVLEISYILPKNAFFLLVVFLILVYLASEKTPEVSHTLLPCSLNLRNPVLLQTGLLRGL